MARLDVYRLPGGAMALDCQSDQLDHLSSRFTVPLVPADDLTTRVSALHPVLEIAGEQCVMATHLAGAVPARALTDRVASLKAQEYVIQRALDTLIATY